MLSGSARQILALAGLLGALVLAFVWIIEPLQARRAAAAAGLAETRALAEWLASQRAPFLAATASGSQTESETGALSLAAVEGAVAGSPLATALRRMAPRSQNRVELSFEAVAFADLVAWLAATRPSPRVAALDITRTDTAGQVDARLVLTLSPAAP